MHALGAQPEISWHGGPWSHSVMHHDVMLGAPSDALPTPLCQCRVQASAVGLVPFLSFFRPHAVGLMPCCS